MQRRTRRMWQEWSFTGRPGRLGAVVVCMIVLSACSIAEAVDTLSNIPPPPEGPPAVPVAPGGGAGAHPATPEAGTAPGTGHDRSRTVIPAYTPYQRKPIPSYRPPDTQISPPASVQLDRLEDRLDHLRRDTGGDRSDRRLSPRTEDAGRALDNAISNRIRALERDGRAGR